MTQDIAQWLLDDIISGAGIVDAGAELCRRLCLAGVPVDRSHLLVLLRHPLYHGRSFRWDPDAGMRVEHHHHGLQQHPGWRQSIFRAMLELEEAEGAVIDLRGELAEKRVPIPSLKDEGFTGYVAYVFTDSEGRRHIISFATRASGGFTTEHADVLFALRERIALRVEIAMRRDFSRQILSTYLGDDPARRVLDGSTRRGDIETIDATIWFSDLRDFTRLCTRLSPESLGDLLADYFQVVVDTIRGHGGEVLKFIGDAVLAVFRSADGTERDAGLAAIQAAHEVVQQLQGLDATWRQRGGACRAGVALHCGTVLYGNVGARDRLDFTVIGPAVNLASRIEGCGKSEGAHVVATEAFVERTKVPARCLGEFTFSGIDGPQKVYALSTRD